MSDHILALVADDMSLQGELMVEVHKLIKQKYQDNRTLLQAKEAVNFYCEAYRQIQQTYAERNVLNPLGLNFETYYKKQQQGELNETATEFISNRLADYKLPFGIETIIAGTDHIGPHIYVITNDDIRCETIRGYAAIGGGAEYAESQFRVAQFSRRESSVNTCLLTYIAKKRAEVIEGVGSETDMGTIYPDKKHAKITEAGHKLLHKEYLKLERQIKKNEEKARENLRKIVQSIATEETGIGNTEVW